MRKIIFSFFIFLLLTNTNVSAQEILNSARSANTHVTLISEVTQVKRGDTFWLAVVLKMDPHWHVYWKNPGDSGLPPKISWDVSNGVSIGEMKWPYPERIDYGDLTSYGFEGEIALLVPFSVSDNFSGDEIAFKADVGFLACEQICIPGQANLALTVPVSDATIISSLNKNKFKQARLHWPIITDRWNIRVYDVAGAYHLFLSAEDPKQISNVSFYPNDDLITSYYAQQQFEQHDGLYELVVQKSDVDPQKIDQLKGVLVSENGWGLESDHRAIEINAEVEVSDVNQLMRLRENISDDSIFGKWLHVILPALFFAFLGGIILNLMPCVLPILSIKVLSLVEHSQDRSRAWVNGLIFTLGILVSFWVLAGLLILLRLGGEHIGWGFQFQSPAFIAFMIVVLFVMTLNFFGLYTISFSALSLGADVTKRSGYMNSFLSGVLATLVSTPCSAPFMGTAIAFALSQSVVTALLVFTFLGLGLASPYLLLARFPALLKFVPKPGAWMYVLRSFLGFLILTSVIWLLWVFGLQVGVDAMAQIIFGLLSFGFALWILGLSQQVGYHQKNIARILSLVFFVLGCALTVSSVKANQIQDARKIQKNDSVWEPYSKQRLNQLLAEKQTVFIDFTAAWCLSCQVNKRVALHNKDVQAAFKAKNVILMRADWTNHDPVITEALAEYGKNSIPVYVFYQAGKKQPEFLPEILTPQIVLNFLNSVNDY